MPLRAVVTDTEKDVKRLQIRDEDKIGKIERARNVNHNAVVIAGTRIPVKTIKRFAEDGYSVEQIIKEYPTLTEVDIKAAIWRQKGGQGLLSLCGDVGVARYIDFSIH